jgi:hypothetical protein
MKAASFAYQRPSDLNAALVMMANRDGITKIIAGGQSLGPMLNLRLVEPDIVIDIAGLSERKQAERSGHELVIGACVTHGDIEDGRIPDVTRGAMQRVAGAIAYRAVRNRGTIGGSLSHADPAADWVSALSALGAKVTLRILAGIRRSCDRGFCHGGTGDDAVGTLGLRQSLPEERRICPRHCRGADRPGDRDGPRGDWRRRYGSDRSRRCHRAFRWGGSRATSNGNSTQE